MRTRGIWWARRFPTVALWVGIALAFGCSSEPDSGSAIDNPPESDILTARSTDDGDTWTAPAALNFGPTPELGSDEAPQLTTDGLAWLAVWHATSFEDPVRTDFDVLVSHSADGGFTWTDQAELNSSASTDVPPEGDLEAQLTTDDGTNWVAVWHSTAGYNRPPAAPNEPPTPPDNDILTARSTDGGLTWTAQVNLNTNAQDDDGEDVFPQLTTDGQDLWIAVWPSTNSLGTPIRTDWDILMARSTDAGATWTDPSPLNTNAPGAGGDDTAPQLTTDATDWVAVWQSTDPLGNTIGKDVDILVARLVVDPGSGVWSWTDAVYLNTNAPGDAGDDRAPQLTTDGTDWVAVWESTDSLNDTIGTDADILLARLKMVDPGTGDWIWDDPVPLNTNAGSDAENDNSPQLTTDDGTNWVAVWQSMDSL